MASKPKTLTAQVEARGKPSREINREIKDLIAKGHEQIRVLHTEAQHNLAVGILTPVSIVIEGSVGYYGAALIDGPELEIQGNSGWGLGESMMAGKIRLQGNAGNSCAASLRGGTVVVHGTVGARAGISMKGGLLIVEEDCGYMTGFMMQKGVIIVCGDTGPGLGDSMYEGCIYVGGTIRELGNDAVVREVDDNDRQFLEENLSPWAIPSDRPFQKVVSGRRLWNFDKHEMDLWKAAL
jgi:glutamate synthase domain-containing protein 3